MRKDLLEAFLVVTGFVLVLGPVPRAVGSETLVGQDNVARLGLEGELELGVGEDDAALGRVLLAGLEDLHRELRDAVGDLLAPAAGVLLDEVLLGLLGRDVLVVLAERRLGARRVDGAAGDGVAFPQTG